VIGAVEMYSTWTLLDVSKYSVCYGFHHCSEFILQIFLFFQPLEMFLVQKLTCRKILLNYIYKTNIKSIMIYLLMYLTVICWKIMQHTICNKLFMFFLIIYNFCLLSTELNEFVLHC
jgi:hypothetical protein